MSLPLPSLPTDNLYKFMALGGVVLLIVAPVYWATFTIVGHQRKMEAIRGLLVGAERPYEYYVQPTPPPDRAAAKAEADRLGKLREQVERNEAESQRASDASWPYWHFESAVNCVAIVMVVMGFASAISGFCLWYTRVQRPLDILLAKQVKSAQESGVLHSPPPP